MTGLRDSQSTAGLCYCLCTSFNPYAGYNLAIMCVYSNAE